MHILRLQCHDRPGIVAAVAATLCDAGCNIEESAQFNDPFSGCFFMRVVFSSPSEKAVSAFKSSFESVIQKFNMRADIVLQSKPVRTLILVSKADHCLNDLLYRWRTKQINIEITGVASNHEAMRGLVEERGLPFHVLPDVDKNTQEKAMDDLVQSTNAELIVLARYMQVLSNDLCEKYAGRIINIHHSFLPGFKGAKPYHQAYERGVKIIGATAHFATSELDEGPIIEQETVRIDHSYDPKRMQIVGKDTESRVLARAVKLYTEHRIFLHGARTIVL